MAAWQRCERCRKVLPAESFDGSEATCRACLAGPVPKVRAARASGVTTTRTRSAPAVAAAPEQGPRRPLLGVAGSGDLEVRERRARRAALDSLAELYADEFDQLLQAARRAEGLRSPS